MTYTIGTSHGPFTGTGSFVIAKPAGIRTIVTNIPSWTGHENESPRRYFRLGRFTLGNADGFSESQLLEYAQQLVYPIAPIWELLAYDINDGASCTFYELVDVPAVTALQPWDRTPLPVTIHVGGYLTPGGSRVTLGTYTVPTGRRYRMESLTLALTTLGAPGNTAYSDVTAARGGNTFAYLISWHQTLGQRETSQPLGAALHFSPGEVLTFTSIDQHSGGALYATVTASGFLFDA